MRLAFCDYHICAILKLLDETGRPLDQLLSTYFRHHKSIGAHDRRFIGEHLYQMVRYQSLIDCVSSPAPLDRLLAYRQLDQYKQDPSLPLSARLGMSEFLYQKFCTLYGEKKAIELSHICNTQAPITIRVNPLKTTREALMALWENKFEMKPCGKLGIQFAKREPLFALPEFKAGLFEVQDEGSQEVSLLVEAQPGQHVVDYCSGSGGKTLGFAPSMQGKGQIYLHDNRPWILLEAKKRLRRAGIQNVQFILPKQKVDWMLTDVPCSGSGTLRRNPDAKWKIDAPMVQRLVLEQRAIVKEAIELLRPNGHFVYATCSIFSEENEHQVEYFLQNHPLELIKTLSWLPQEGGKDGFFAAVLKKKNLVSSNTI